MGTLAAQVAQKLLEINAIKLKPNDPFTWASGLKSPIYCDNRISLSHPKVRDFIKESLKEKSRVFGEFDIIAGVATAGIPHGSLLADLLDKPFIYVRSAAKSHGRQNMIEGELPENSKILVIEDLISTGKSSIAACDALTSAGAAVIGVMAIFTYGFPQAAQIFTEKKIPLDTLTNYRNLLVQALETNYITEAEKVVLQSWNTDPQLWSSERGG